MNFSLSPNRSHNTAQSEKEYTPELISHPTQIYAESEGGEFLDDAIRTHEQPLPNAVESNNNS